MLVLTRKQNEKIQIGDNVFLTVLRIKGNTVRLGIEAPQDVRVVRGELPPQPEQPKVKKMTLLVTDPASGEIRERWNHQAQDETPQAPGETQSLRETQSRKGPKDLESINQEVHRLKQLVASVGRASWTTSSPMAQR
jgi:carbon storage regulator CsrA